MSKVMTYCPFCGSKNLLATLLGVVHVFGACQHVDPNEWKCKDCGMEWIAVSHYPADGKSEVKL